MIAIVTLYTPDIEYAYITTEYNNRYAKKHGYCFVEYCGSLDKTRKPHWSKILAITANLVHFDWVWWLDVDAIVMDHGIKLESIIDENYDFIIGNDPYTKYNSGSMLLRGCKENIEFMNQVYSDTEQAKITNKYGEQPAIIKLIDSQQSPRTKIIDKRIFNSFYGYDYKSGDFVLHLPGKSNKERLSVFKNIAKLNLLGK